MALRLCDTFIDVRIPQLLEDHYFKLNPWPRAENERLLSGWNKNRKSMSNIMTQRVKMQPTMLAYLMDTSSSLGSLIMCLRKCRWAWVLGLLPSMQQMQRKFLDFSFNLVQPLLKQQFGSEPMDDERCSLSLSQSFFLTLPFKQMFYVWLVHWLFCYLFIFCIFSEWDEGISI